MEVKVVQPGVTGSLLINVSNGSSVKGAGRSHSSSLSHMEAASILEGAMLETWLAIKRLMIAKLWLTPRFSTDLRHEYRV